MENLFFPLELLTALTVYGIRLEKRDCFRIRLAGAVILVCVMMAVLLGGGKSLLPGVTTDAGLTLAGTMLVCGFIFLLMAVLVWITCRVSFQEAVYCATCAYLTEHIAYCLRLIIKGFTGIGTGPGTIVYLTVHTGVYVLSYYIFARKMAKEKHYATSAVKSFGFMTIVLFLVLGMSVAASVRDFETIHGIYALFCCIFVLYSQLKQLSQLSLQEELNVQKQLWMRHKAQYEMSKETIDIINRKCHDLKHQVAALRGIENLEKRSDAIDSIEESVMIYDSMPQTGNTILDTVLTEKSLVCSQEKINMTCIADGGLLDFMDAVDLYTLFGNALDNAVEGVRKLPVEQRCISLLLHKKAGLIFIQIENPYLEEIVLENGIPMTSKHDRNYHGFGIRSIIHTAEKYGGFVTIETEYKIFLLRLTIPAVQVTTQKRQTGTGASE
mgnify:CR=1 FL=1